MKTLLPLQHSYDKRNKQAIKPGSPLSLGVWVRAEKGKSLKNHPFLQGGQKSLPEVADTSSYQRGEFRLFLVLISPCSTVQLSLPLPLPPRSPVSQ